MLIYEKDNKLNISFENNMDETDIVVGKDEVKIGEATISDSNVLPVPEEGDVGKVPTVQEDGSYALAESGGSGGGMVLEMVFDRGGPDSEPCFKSQVPIVDIADAYKSGQNIVLHFPDDPDGWSHGYSLGAYGGYATVVTFVRSESFDGKFTFCTTNLSNGQFGQIMDESIPSDLTDPDEVLKMPIYVD